jgi:hypothetical protein
MSTEKKYIEWDLEKFKAGWPAEWSGSPARFIAHIPDADEYSRLAWLVEGVLYASTDSGTCMYRSPLRLLERTIDPHPDNKDGLYRDQIGDGWRIKGHGEKLGPADEIWSDGRWGKRDQHKLHPGNTRTYRTRDPLPEPAFKVGDRVVNTQGEKGEVVKVDPMLGNSAVRVRYDDGTFGTYTMDGTVRFTDNSAAITKLTTRTVPLGPEDIVLGKTVVRPYDGAPENLATSRGVHGIICGVTHFTWQDLRDAAEISHDHGATWQKAEKEVEG